MSTPEPEYVAARCALLDTLDALGSHASAVTLVGAQAIYLRVGESGVSALAPYTTDADLALRPADIGVSPNLRRALVDANLRPTDQPGIWTKDEVEVDLMVPEALAGEGRRGADLGRHDRLVARRARGLEACMEDRSLWPIGALDPTDHRIREAWVAGEAALLVAKVHKIWDRRDDRKRRRNKDAHDILRLLRACPTEQLAARLADLAGSELAGETTREALEYIGSLFGSRGALGSEMVAGAVAGVEDPDTEAMSAVVLVGDVLLALRDREPLG